MRTLSVFLAISLSSTLLVTPAGAQTTGNQAERAAAYQHARDAMTAGDWRGAVRIFSELWAKSHTYDVALGLGQAELNLERYRDAAEHLSFGLRNLPAKEKPELEGKATRGLKFAKQRVGALRVSVEPGATLLVDGIEAGTAPIDWELFVEPGEHSVEGRVPNKAPARETVTVKAGESQPVALVFSGPALLSSGSPPIAPTPPAATAPINSGLDAPPPAAAPQPPQHRGNSTNKLLVVGAGAVLTVAGLAVGTAYAISGSSKQSDVDRLKAQAQSELGGNCIPGSALTTCVNLSRAADDRNSANQTARVAFIASGVFAVGTIATFLLWPSEGSGEHARIEPSFGRDGGLLTFKGAF